MLNSHGIVQRYVFAFAIFGIAFILRLLVDQIAPTRAPFLTFFPAVFLTAWLCGWMPAVLVLIMASASTWSVWADDPIIVRVFVLSVFSFMCASGIFFIDRLKAAQALAQAQTEQSNLINSELHHRIKNIFSITASLCSSTIRLGLPTDEAVKAINGRIQAVAKAQELINATSSKGAAIADLVSAVVAPMAPSKIRIQFKGPDIELKTETATSFALILHELATNALKYGAWVGPTGIVKINWDLVATASFERELDFRWAELDGPKVLPCQRKGFGSKLIRQALPMAKVEHDLNEDGLRCRIRVILP